MTNLSTAQSRVAEIRAQLAAAEQELATAEADAAQKRAAALKGAAQDILDRIASRQISAAFDRPSYSFSDVDYYEFLPHGGEDMTASLSSMVERKDVVDEHSIDRPNPSYTNYQTVALTLMVPRADVQDILDQYFG